MVIFLLFFIAKVSFSQKCVVGTASSCFICNSAYYSQSTPPFADTNCLSRTGSINLDVLVFPSKPATFTTSFTRVYTALDTALVQLSQEANQYLSGNVNLFLTNEAQFIRPVNMQGNGGRLFRWQLITITIQTLPCTKESITGFCATLPTDRSTINLKSENIYFFIAKSLTISNIVINGGDLVFPLGDPTDVSKCYNSATTSCCSTNDYSNSASPCFIQGKSFTFTNKNSLYGLFNPELFDFAGSTIPTFGLTNVAFNNFNSLGIQNGFLSIIKIPSFPANIAINGLVFTSSIFQNFLFTENTNFTSNTNFQHFDSALYQNTNFLINQNLFLNAGLNFQNVQFNAFNSFNCLISTSFFRIKFGVKFTLTNWTFNTMTSFSNFYTFDIDSSAFVTFLNGTINSSQISNFAKFSASNIVFNSTYFNKTTFEFTILLITGSSIFTSNDTKFENQKTKTTSSPSKFINGDSSQINLAYYQFLNGDALEFVTSNCLITLDNSIISGSSIYSPILFSHQKSNISSTNFTLTQLICSNLPTFLQHTSMTMTFNQMSINNNNNCRFTTIFNILNFAILVQLKNSIVNNFNSDTIFQGLIEVKILEIINLQMTNTQNTNLFFLSDDTQKTTRVYNSSFTNLTFNTAHYFIRSTVSRNEIINCTFNDLLGVRQRETNPMWAINFEEVTDNYIYNVSFLNVGYSTYQDTHTFSGWEMNSVSGWSSINYVMINCIFEMRKNYVLQEFFSILLVQNYTEVTNCTFLNNRTVQSSNFEENQLKGITVHTPLNILFQNNTMVNFICNSILNSNLYFVHNHGAVTFYAVPTEQSVNSNKAALIQNNYFNNCQCGTGKGGALVLVNYRNVTLKGNKFQNSYAPSGAHLFIVAATNVSLNSDSFQESLNSSNNILIKTISGTLTITNIYVFNTQRRNDNTLVISSASTVIITNLTISNSNQLSNYAGISIENSNAIFTGIRLVGINANTFGGYINAINMNSISIDKLAIEDSNSNGNIGLYFDTMTSCMLSNVILNRTVGQFLYFTDIDTIGLNTMVVDSSKSSNQRFITVISLKGSPGATFNNFLFKNFTCNVSEVFFYDAPSPLIFQNALINNSFISGISFSFTLANNFQVSNVTFSNTIVAGQMIFVSNCIFSFSQLFAYNVTVSNPLITVLDSTGDLNIGQISGIITKNVVQVIHSDNGNIIVNSLNVSNNLLPNLNILSLYRSYGNFTNVNISSINGTILINLEQSSFFFGSNVVTNIIGDFLFSQDSNVTFSNISMNQIYTSSNAVIKIFKTIYPSFTEFIDLKFQVWLGRIFNVEEINQILVKNFVFIGNNQSSAFKIINVKSLIMMNGSSNFLKDNQGSFADLKNIQSSSFDSLKVNNSLAEVGGCFYLQNAIEVNYTNSVFSNNIANKTSTIGSGVGSVIYNLCNDKCKLNFSNCSFQGNQEKSINSVIFSNAPLVIPNGLSNSEVLNVYSNYYSIQVNSPFIIASGQKVNLTVKVFNQNRSLDFDSLTTATLLAQSPITVENNLATMSNGVLTFPRLVSKSKPNSSSVITLAIDLKLSNIFSGVQNLLLNKPINVTYRPCLPGEILKFSDQTCQYCAPGSYSLVDPMSALGVEFRCKLCPSVAHCEGGNKIFPLNDYYSYSPLSDLIYPCPQSKTCLGGNSSKPSSCVNGNEGIFCDKCSVGYGKVDTGNPCSPCTEQELTIGLRFTGILLGLSFYIWTLSWFLVTFQNEKGDKAINALLNIFLGHFQILSILNLQSIDFSFISFSSVVTATQYFSLMNTGLLAADCYVYKIGEYDEFGYLLVKSIVYIILPIMINVILMIVWISIKRFAMKKKHKLLKKFMDSFKRTQLIFIFVMINLFYPLITNTSLGYLSCFHLSSNPNVDVLFNNRMLKCYEKGYYILVGSISFPLLLIFGFIFPIFLLYMLQKQRAYNIEQKQFNRPITSTLGEGPSLQSSGDESLKESIALDTNRKQDTVRLNFSSRVSDLNSINNDHLLSRQEKIETQHGVKFKSISQNNRRKSSVIMPDMIVTNYIVENHILVFYTEGYTNNFCYWEAVKIIMKFLVSFFINMKSLLLPRAQVTALLSIFVIYFYFLYKSIPYSDWVCNRLEMVASVIWMISVMSLDLSVTQNQTYSQAFNLAIMGLNIIFITVFAYTIITTAWKFLKRLRKKMNNSLNNFFSRMRTMKDKTLNFGTTKVPVKLKNKN